MPQVENSEVVRHVLQTLVDISGRKTTQIQAVLTLSELIKKLEEKYTFLKHIEVKDVRYSEMDAPISVMSDIDGVESNDIGKALYDIIKTMNTNLGKDAGHFFIRELRNRLGDTYSSTIEEMGVYLGLMQLEFEVDEMTKKL
jgi:hypothetical protein